ncbi:hypothetical protein IEQ34_006031 [Dendrobium chrysotoxum]|uniref:RRM domain-containing protein n=1 Tax=Dendrobium chrysotoxum TaxID=161865 RepID=A0AAV7HD17_DENCH|nr:hypothetical protein IEQ34_006031 [Dendrobium chrysotoxum]
MIDLSMAAFNPPSALDLVLFHRQERDFFNRLVHRLGQPRLAMHWVMSLWLWFESIGHHDFIRHVSSSPDHVVLRFLAEAYACLHRLIFNTSSDQEEDEQLPLTNTHLLADPIGLSFFDHHRHAALKGVVYFLKNVSEIIFDDHIMEIATRQVLSSDRLHIWRPSVQQSVGEEPSHQLLQQHSCTSSALMLNPIARPWSPETEQWPEEQRSMFITFSRGYPLTRDEIKDFFNMKFGWPCVERVMIERAPMGMEPMYGRVVFTDTSMIVAVLNGQKTAKFMIKGRHLWARMYVPRHSTK